MKPPSWAQLPSQLRAVIFEVHNWKVFRKPALSGPQLSKPLKKGPQPLSAWGGVRAKVRGLGCLARGGSPARTRIWIRRGDPLCWLLPSLIVNTIHRIWKELWARPPIAGGRRHTDNPQRLGRADRPGPPPPPRRPRPAPRPSPLRGHSNSGFRPRFPVPSFLGEYHPDVKVGFLHMSS